MFVFLYRRKMIKAYWRVMKLNSIYGAANCTASSEAKADLHYYAFMCGRLDSPYIQAALNMVPHETTKE